MIEPARTVLAALATRAHPHAVRRRADGFRPPHRALDGHQRGPIGFPRLVALALAALAGLTLAPPPAAAQETDVGVFLHAFQPAWSSGDVHQVLALLAPEAVVQLNYREPGGPAEFRGTGPGSMTLHDGVALLLEAGARPDFATYQTAPTVFGGAPATTLSWTYRRPSLVRGVPQEVGTDELVLQGGQLLAYTRMPDRAIEASRGLALERVVSQLAARQPIATDGPSADGAGPPPSLYEHDRPTAGSWITAAAASLLGAVTLTLLKTLRRPRRVR